MGVADLQEAIDVRSIDRVVWAEYKGRSVAATCAECGVGTSLIIQINGRTGKPFLGCPNWPDCKYTKEVSIDIEMELAGAQRLPGM